MWTTWISSSTTRILARGVSVPEDAAGVIVRSVIVPSGLLGLTQLAAASLGLARSIGGAITASTARSRLGVVTGASTESVGYVAMPMCTVGRRRRGKA